MTVRVCKTIETYEGYAIDFNIYGQGEYSVQFGGDDFLFKTLSEAKGFIDSLDED